MTFYLSSLLHILPTVLTFVIVCIFACRCKADCTACHNSSMTQSCSLSSSSSVVSTSPDSDENMRSNSAKGAYI